MYGLEEANRYRLLSLKHFVDGRRARNVPVMTETAHDREGRKIRGDVPGTPTSPISNFFPRSPPILLSSVSHLSPLVSASCCLVANWGKSWRRWSAGGRRRGDTWWWWLALNREPSKERKWLRWKWCRWWCRERDREGWELKLGFLFLTSNVIDYPQNGIIVPLHSTRVIHSSSLLPSPLSSPLQVPTTTTFIHLPSPYFSETY